MLQGGSGFTTRPVVVQVNDKCFNKASPTYSFRALSSLLIPHCVACEENCDLVRILSTKDLLGFCGLVRHAWPKQDAVMRPNRCSCHVLDMDWRLVELARNFDSSSELMENPIAFLVEL